ncbi:B12-binding domain-containing radical SAM protein [Nocardia sp. alder85J]|uniref:B12-binding domain-containing radical SAM protein n=1 Tax=Nocardia sp. alder85J TaxID=2862949 RepID=UPI001CD584C9|nr:radical SAM protein [Nocardia sp. alder85J]MCX4098045.1 radical SAM protein [Nocardia sp. alder85J]
MTNFLGLPGKRPLVILLYPKVDHEKDYVYFWMPFSLLTLAKPLLDDDLADVVLFDGNQRSDADWERFLDEHLDRAVCIGVSIMTGGGQIGHALELVRRAKERSNCPPVVFGGPHVNVLPEQTARHELVDAVLVGPGQNSFPAFVTALNDYAGWEAVPGLIARRAGDLIRGPVNPPRTGLMGHYPWHLLDIEQYVRDDPTVAPRTLNYISSQGCVYKCQFCYELTYQRKYSAMAADGLVADIDDLRRRYGLNGIKFYDADWFVNLRRAAAFCEGVIEGELDIRWAASINPNDILKSRRAGIPLLELVQRSGGSRLLMGIESGNERVLRDVVRKEVTPDHILDVTADIAAHGLLGSYTFIVGFPGETDDEVDDTYALIEQLRQLDPTPETRVHLFAPYPGTPLYEDAVRAGFEPPSTLEDWSHFDYYDSQTPWTSAATVARARAATQMRLKPEAVGQC